MKAADVLLRQFPAVKGKTPIYIVDIDSKSLRSHGQWPWPRSLIAKLVADIVRGKPKAVGFDIVFAEPDRTAPREVIAQLWSGGTAPAAIAPYFATLPDPDRSLAAVLGKGPTVLGYVFLNATGRGTNRPKSVSGRFAAIGTNHQPWLFRFAGVDANLPVLEQAASGSGFFNILPDIDGVVRKEPLVIEYEGQLYPSLVLEMVRIGSRASTGLIRSGRNGLESVQMSSYKIPTDGHGQFIVRFLGPPGSFPYISAEAILSGRVDPAIFEGSYVLIGTSAPGLLDLRTTPISQAFPGVEIHANALNTVLTEAYLEKPAWATGAELVYLVLVSALLIVLLPRIGAAASGFVLFLLSAAIGYFSYWNFVHNNLVIDIVYPLLITVALFTAMTFFNYLQEEQRSKKIRGAFSQYLSPVLVNQLLKNPDLLTLTGEERCMSILFSDIRGFTSISEKMAPQEPCRFINQYLTPMTEIIMAYRGTVDKFIGDAVMAFWNAPLDDPEHAANSCRAALEMQHKLKRLNRQWQEQGLVPVTIGVGIHTGMTRVGNMGSEHRFDYTVMGDTVNLASRLEGITKLYGTNIVVSEATRNMLKDDESLVFREIDRVRVKGKKNAITVFELVDEIQNLGTERLEELKRHEHALGLYYQSNFKTALRAFAKLAEMHSRTPLYRLYMDRCRRLLADPPRTGWDGVTTLTSK